MSKALSKELVDLHVHTTASDGTLTPRELVEHAFQNRLKAVAITDHDTIDGIEEALQTGREKGVEIVPGVEIGVDYPGEMHILGYYIDHHNTQLAEGLKLLLQFRSTRNPQIIEKLRQLGLDITMEEVIQEAGGDVVGRPHIASVLVKKGFIREISEAFDKYLAAGKPAYVPKDRLTPKEGIELITGAGGIAVLAHPKYLTMQKDKCLKDLLLELKGYGLQGIEAYYTTYSQAETAMYLQLGEECGLTVTGGSDFHGANKPEIQLGHGEGNLTIPYQILEGIKRLRNKATINH